MLNGRFSQGKDVGTMTFRNTSVLDYATARTFWNLIGLQNSTIIRKFNNDNLRHFPEMIILLYVEDAISLSDNAENLHKDHDSVPKCCLNLWMKRKQSDYFRSCKLYSLHFV